jgi:hypothetical protein
MYAVVDGGVVVVVAVEGEVVTGFEISDLCNFFFNPPVSVAFVAETRPFRRFLVMSLFF